MTVLLILGVSAVVLLVGGHVYSRFLARSWGEDASRPTPAVLVNDGRDFVPTPTPVVFAHHFASIAGAGPIIGPVVAVCYGWLPALLWVVLGGLLIGAVHDYLAAFMSVREGGHSVATITRRILGKGPFLALMIFLVTALALVCAAFLNLSAQALVSMVPHARLDMSLDQTLFRTVTVNGELQVVIGGIASTSVIIITLAAPFVGWMYIKRQVAVWKCSLVAVVVCAVSVTAGLYHPVAFPAGKVLGALEGIDVWKLILAAYVVVAAGVPVWLFLQSRDFINVHILYVGLGGLTAALAFGALRAGGAAAPGEALPAVDIAAGATSLGPFWPTFFVTIACGAVSGFHSLCAGGTTCKQLTSEPAARRVGYWGMLLESFLAVCVVSVMILGATRMGYLADVHPKLAGLKGGSNPVLGFALAVGNAVNLAFGTSKAVGALAGMVLLEGFLVTTLDTAVRLSRYLLEEIWRVLLGAPEPSGQASGPGASSLAARILGHYWVNSALAAALMLLFAFSGGLMTLWKIFATANQLLAALVLLLGALWLLERGKRAWYVILPAAAMLVTTVASLLYCASGYIKSVGDFCAKGNIRSIGDCLGAPWESLAPMREPGVLLAADLILLAMTAYLVAKGAAKAVRIVRGGAAASEKGGVAA